jgi:hypothetical protein
MLVNFRRIPEHDPKLSLAAVQDARRKGACTQQAACQAIQLLCTAAQAAIKLCRAVSMGDRCETIALHLQSVCNLGEDQHTGGHRLQVAPWHLQHSPCSACARVRRPKCQTLT